MVILCDTSSVLLLLRINPEMFRDKRFDCRMIREVHDELIRTTRFKTRYPWLRDYRDRLKFLLLDDDQKKSEKQYHRIVELLNENGTIDTSTGKFFDLSGIDKKVISHCLALECRISSGDGGIIRFLTQEFPIEFKGSASALELINDWLTKKHLKWNETHQNIIEEWITLNEHKQPISAIKEFQSLTGFKYPK